MQDKRNFNADDDLEEQINELTEIAETTSSVCILAKSIALSDPEVKNLFTRKVQEGNVYNGSHCIDRMPSFELVYVYFDFDCKPGTACLVKPSFVAVVNIISGKVLDIIDPFIFRPDNKQNGESIFEILGDRTYLGLGNYTGRDLYIKVECDVHTGNWEDLVLNNQEPQIKSKKVPFNEYAKYCFKVYKNNMGHPGEHVGDFDHSIKFDVLGNIDHLIFSIINIGGDDYLQAYSTKTIAEIAKFIWTVS